MRIGSAWASGSVHPIALDGEPKDIAPRITLETLSPDFPSLQKGVLVSLAFLVPTVCSSSPLAVLGYSSLDILDIFHFEPVCLLCSTK
jgi:hypothetical protein